MNTIRFSASKYKNLRIVLDHVIAYSVRENQIYVYQINNAEATVISFSNTDLAVTAAEKLDELFMTTEI